VKKKVIVIGLDGLEPSIVEAMIERGENPPVEMEQELDDLLSKVQVNPAYQRALVAQTNFDKLMMQVNTWISEGIRAGAASPIITLG